MDPMGVPAFATTKSLAADHDQATNTDANDKIRLRLLSLLESEGYNLYDSSGKRLNDLPTPRRLAETEPLKPVQTDRTLKLDKKRLGQLLNKRYDLLLNPVPAQTKKRGPSLSDTYKNTLDDLSQQHGGRRVYDSLVFQAVHEEDQYTAEEDRDGTNFGVSLSVVTREAPVSDYQEKDPTMPQRACCTALSSPPDQNTVQVSTEEMNSMEEKQDANESNNPETMTTESTHPSSSVNARKSLLAPRTLRNIEVEGPKVDLNVKEESLDTWEYSDPLAETASTRRSSPSSRVSEIIEDLHTSRCTNPETASTHNSSPSSIVSESNSLSACAVPNTGFTKEIKGKAEEPDASRYNNPETANRHSLSSSSNVGDSILLLPLKAGHLPQPVVGVKCTDKAMIVGADHDIIDLTDDNYQPHEVHVISTDESDIDEPKSKVSRPEATNRLDINDNSGIYHQTSCRRKAFEPEQSSFVSPIAEQSDHDASHEERASVDDTEIPRELPKDLTHNLSRDQVIVARRKVALQEGRKAQERFTKSLCVPDICRNVSTSPRYVYVSANLNVCLSGIVDILQGNYIFEVKHSMGSSSKKKLGKVELRECLFYMVLCQVDCAFFVVEQLKKIFVVQYDEGAFQEIESRAKELATFRG